MCRGQTQSVLLTHGLVEKGSDASEYVLLYMLDGGEGARRFCTPVATVVGGSSILSSGDMRLS